MTELPAGQVTVADLYRELTGMRRDLAEVITGNRLAEERHTTNLEQHQDYERRLRILERGFWRAAGAAALIAGIISIATALITIKVR